MPAPRFKAGDKDYVQKLNQMGEVYSSAIEANGDAAINAAAAIAAKTAAETAANQAEVHKAEAAEASTSAAYSASAAEAYKDSAAVSADYAAASKDSVAASANAAASSATASENSASAAAASKTTATASANAAASSATASEVSREAAAASANAAASSATASEVSREAAAVSANAAASAATASEDSKAAAAISAAAASSSESNAASSEASASVSASAATEAEANALSHYENAKKWAENPENVSVTAGKYSALHHSAKSEKAAAAASSSEVSAASSAALSEDSATTAGNFASAAASSEANAQAYKSSASVSAAQALGSAGAAQISADVAASSAQAASESATRAETAATQAMVYKGGWDAESGVYPANPKVGWMYKVSTTGTVGLVNYKVNDSIIYNGTDWDHIDNTESVTSVNGKTGPVSLGKADVGLPNARDVASYSYAETNSLLAGKLGSTSTAVAAQKLATAQLITISGGASGSASFDGSAGITITIDIQDDSHTHTIGTVHGLQPALDDKVNSSDDRLANSREWTASTVSQDEAEDGTATTRRAWTSQRVRQAINAVIGTIANASQTVAGWMSPEDKTKLDGIASKATKNATDVQLRDRSTHTGTQAIPTVSGLQAVLDAKVDDSQIAAANGVASLDATGKVPTTQLPGVSYEGHTHEYLPLTGGTISGDVELTSTQATSRVLSIGRSINGTQGTGAVEVTQDGAHGGGISYNGDGTPAFASGEAADAVTFYRKTSGSRYGVFSYPHNSNTVTFNGDIKVGSNTAQSEDVTFDGSTSAGLRLSNSNGYVSITPLNTSWAHVYTDRNNFIFNTPVYSLANIFSSYNNDLLLRRSGTTKLTLGSGQATFVDPVYVGANAVWHAGTFDPTSKSDTGHTHNYLSTLHLSGRGIADANQAQGSGVTTYYLGSGATNKPAGTDHALLTLSFSTGWSTQMASDWRTNEWYVRKQTNDVWDTSWAKLWHSDNFDPATKAEASHTHPWADVTGAPATATRWPTWSEVTSKPATFTPSAHTHALSDLTDAGNLAALSTNASTANYLRGDGTWATPPNTTYSVISTAEIDAGTATTSRVISAARIKYILDKKADTSHGHAITDVTGLQTALDGKAASSHTHDYVPTSRTVNGKPLSSDITLSATDVGAAAAAHTHSISNTTGLQSALESKADSSAVVSLDSHTGAANLPVGTTAQRPSSPVEGMFRRNSETMELEQYDGSSWTGIGGGGSSFGVDQTWQNVTANRAANVAYLNNTGNPIQLVLDSAGSGYLRVSQDGVNYTDLGYMNEWPGIVIPDGYFYKVSYVITTWCELR